MEQQSNDINYFSDSKNNFLNQQESMSGTDQDLRNSHIPVEADTSQLPSISQERDSQQTVYMHLMTSLSLLPLY